MKRLITILCIVCSVKAVAQADLNKLKQEEDTLATYSKDMVSAEDASKRFYADSIFIRTLVRALKTPHSFSYPFDSVNVSKIYAPDSSFRIFTWEIERDESYYKQFGAIQMRTKDGSLN